MSVWYNYREIPYNSSKTGDSGCIIQPQNRSGVRITHELKILPKYYKEVLCGNKTFEIRFNDRDYKAGDIVILKNIETGQKIYKKIGYVCDFAQQPGFVVFSLLSMDKS